MEKSKKYPEHEKLQCIKDKSEICGSFLDWLQNERNPRIQLCEFNENGEEFPCYKRIDQLLAEYFEIDLQKLEKEKLQMIEELKGKQQ